MERRNALKSMAMLIGGAVALPEWANAWSTNSITAKIGCVLIWRVY
jgi:hypothetical protein